MTALLGLAALALHVALMLAAAPLLVGVVRWIKARLTGRRGASPLQPWRDLLRLSRKQAIHAEGSSRMLRAAPVTVFAATLAAAALVPSFVLGMASAPVADLLVLAGLLAMARAAAALAGMDAGTAFGGIGASRVVTFAVFAEPAMLLVIFTLALLAGTTNLDAVAGVLHEGTLGLRVSLGLALVAILAVAIAECGRMPSDNPATHLELTMVHEAMALDYAGADLALIEWSGAIRLLLWMSLIAAIFAPFGIAPAGGSPLEWVPGLVAWAAKVLLLATGLAVLESLIARMRLFQVPEFLGVAILLGLLAVIFLFISQGFA